MTLRSLLCGISALSSCLLIAGCGQQSPTGKTVVASKGVSGVVHGGQNPVSGATIQLYTVGTTGDGTTSRSLLTKTVTTLDDGSFDITGAYSCTGATEVYLTATQGDPDPGIANANLALMVALGPCAAVPSMSYIEVNELTTVAAVNALAPFISSYAAVGSGTGDVAALQAAFTLADEFVDPTTGTAPGVGVPSGYSVPVSEIDTLGNIAAACVNSGGGTAGQGNACGTFFGLTTPSGMTPPSDTIAALLYLAKNPALNTQELYQTPGKDVAFQPTLPGPPENFTVALVPGVIVGSLELNPGSLSFPDTPVGGTADAMSAVITNLGAGAASVSGITVGGTNSGDFAETNDCPSSLEAGAACVIQVTFTPGATAGRSATLGVNGGTLSAGLAGNGVTGGTGPITVSPTTITFDDPVAALDTRLVTVTNTGSSTVGISAVQLSPNYTQITTCGGTLAAGASCYVAVSPTELAGVGSGTLKIVDTDTTSAQTVTLSTNFPPTPSGATLEDFGIGSLTNGNQSVGLLAYVAGVAYPDGLSDQAYNYVYSDTLTIQQGSLFAFDSGDLSCSTTIYGGSSPTPTPASQPCDFIVYFTPQSVGGEVYATASDTSGLNWFLKGWSPYANDFLSPGIVNFGSLALGGNPSAAYPITLYDPTWTDSTYLSATITGEDASDFAVVQTAGPSNLICQNGNTLYGLQPSPYVSPSSLQSCSPISVEFDPSALGVRNALLTVTTTIDTTVIPLQGYGQYQTPPVVFSPTFPVSSFDFGNVTNGMSGVAQTVTVTMADQDAASAQVSGPFVITGPTTCAQNATTCQFTVNFSPTTPGLQTGSLTVTDTVGNVSASATLTGTGYDATAPLTFTPSSTVTFSSRDVGASSLPQTVTVTNTGGYAVTINTVGITGTNPGDYLETDTCAGVTVAPSGTCSVSTTFKPTATGTRSANVSIATAYGINPNLIALTGTGQ